MQRSSLLWELRSLQGLYKDTSQGSTAWDRSPAFVCHTLKRVSHKQATKVDYNRLRPCKPYFWYSTTACNVRRWISGVRRLQCVWRRDTNEGFKIGTPCYRTLLWCDTALISARNCVVLSRINMYIHMKGSNRVWKGIMSCRSSLCSSDAGPGHKFEKNVTFMNEYTSWNKPINSERSWYFLRIDNFISVKKSRIYIRIPDYDNENRDLGLIV